MEKLQLDVESPKMTTRGPETAFLEIKKKSKYGQKVKKPVKDKKAAESLENPTRKQSLAQLKLTNPQTLTTPQEFLIG